MVRSRPARIPWAAIGAIGVGLAAFGISIWRLMPGVGFWDTAEFQMVLPVMGTAHPTGYPTYVLLGWLASVVLTPIGEPALRVNVLSAILVGVGAAFTADLARRLSRSVVLGVVAGIGTATAPIVWAIGTHADPHALHFAFIAVILWLLVRWEQARRGDPLDPGVRAAPQRADRYLLAAAVVTGLSVGNHSLTLLLGPPIILFVKAVEPGILARRRFILANIAAFAIPTILVRFEMILRAGWFRAPFVYADPSTWTGFWYVTLGAQFHGWLTDPFSDAGRRFGDLITMATRQFGPLAALIVVAFVVTALRRRRYALLSGVTMLLTCFFNSVYPDGAIDRYYIGPVLIAWTWLAVLGATVVDVVVAPDAPWLAVLRIGRGVTASLRPAALVLAAVVLIGPTIQATPARAGSNAIDQTGNRAAQAWTDDLLTALEPNAVVVSWWSYSTTLWYATIVEGRRPDILIIDDRNRVDLNLLELSQVIDIYLASRPVYLIRNGTSELDVLEVRYRIEPVGAPVATNVLRVLPIATAGR